MQVALGKPVIQVVSKLVFLYQLFQGHICRLLTLSLLLERQYAAFLILQRYKIDIQVLTGELLLFLTVVSPRNLGILSKYMKTTTGEFLPPGFADRLQELSPVTYELVSEAIEPAPLEENNFN